MEFDDRASLDAGLASDAMRAAGRNLREIAPGLATLLVLEDADDLRRDNTMRPRRLVAWRPSCHQSTPAATVQRMRPLEGRLFSLSPDNQNGMIARPEDWDLDDVGLLRGEVVPDEPVVLPTPR